MLDRVRSLMVAPRPRGRRPLETRQVPTGQAANTRSAAVRGRTAFAVRPSEYTVGVQPATASGAVPRQARTLVGGAIGTGVLARRRPPMQLVTPEVAARLAGISVAEVLRCYSTGSGPRAHCVGGCWVSRAREVDALSDPAAAARTAGGRGSMTGRG